MRSNAIFLPFKSVTFLKTVKNATIVFLNLNILYYVVLFLHLLFQCLSCVWEYFFITITLKYQLYSHYGVPDNVYNQPHKLSNLELLLLRIL